MSPLARKATLRNLAAGRTRPQRKSLRQWAEQINPDFVVGAVMLFLAGYLAGWQVAELAGRIAL